jgi:hypothetical protein
MHSQTSSIKPPRVQTIINNGDTLIQMKFSDAKVILKAVLDGEIADSLLSVYQDRDSLLQKTITLQVSEIRLLELKSDNQEILAKNLNSIITNKDSEINILNDIIVKQKKEIRKQKTLKVIGFIGSVALPIVTLLIILGVTN